MYWEIGKIDIVTSNDRGQSEAHQSDARTPEEISAQPALSVLLAIARVANTPEDFALTQYHCAHEPPSFLAEAVCAAGAQLLVNFEPRVPSPTRPLALIVNEAMTQLAAACGATQDLDGNYRILANLEAETLALPPPENSFSYYERLLQLASLAGACIPEGTWQVDQKYSVVPFSLVVGGATANVTGKAERFLERGEAQKLTNLVSAIRGMNNESPGIASIVLKPHRWPGNVAIAKPVFSGPPGSESKIPWVVAAYDRGDSLAFPKRNELTDIESELSRHIDEFCSRNIEVEMQVEMGGITQISVVEKILDQPFMALLQMQLNAALLFVGVPSSGLMLVIADDKKASLEGFVGLVGSIFAESVDTGEDVSPTVFAVSEGKIQGVILEVTSES